MIKFTRILFRENLEKSFYVDDDEFLSYIEEQYIKTNKCLQWRKPIYEMDNHVLKTESIWASPEFYSEGLSDPKILLNYENMVVYNFTNNIIILSTDTSQIT